MPANLTSFALNCSLKSSRNEEKSSTDRILHELGRYLSERGIETAPPDEFFVRPRSARARAFLDSVMSHH